MLQPPKALGLFICDQVIFDRDTQKPSLIGRFAGMGVGEFPSGPQRLDVFAALTDGLGAVTIDLTVTHLDTEEQDYARGVVVEFPDPLRLIQLRCRVGDCSFPDPGSYMVTQSVADTEIAHCRLRVYLRESP
jgi:hypothetical protein